jgi:putative FmdB family regulatory protein
MPTYDYVCNACGHALEAFQSINEPVLRKCPRCKKPKLERRICAGAGILFKGGGFYQTDYRSESYKQGESSEKDGGKSKDSAPAPAPAKTPATAPNPPATASKPSSSAPKPSSSAQSSPPSKAKSKKKD